jgi:hypothetical protein
MHMVGHQAVGPDLDAALAGLFGQQVAVDLLIPILEEDRLAPVAALGHVVRKAGDDSVANRTLTRSRALGRKSKSAGAEQLELLK